MGDEMNVPAKREEIDSLLEAILPPQPLTTRDAVLQTLRFNAGASGGFYKLGGGGGSSDPVPSVQAVVLGNKDMRVLMPPMQGGQPIAGAKPRCKSIDGKESSYGEFKGRQCETCELAQWKDNRPPECSYEKALLLWLVDLEMPAVVCFKRKGLKPTNDFLARLSTISSVLKLPNGAEQRVVGYRVPYLYPIVIGAEEAVSGGNPIHVPTFSIVKDAPLSYEEIIKFRDYAHGLFPAFESYGQMRQSDDDEDALEGETVDVEEEGSFIEMGMDTTPMDEVLLPQNAASVVPEDADSGAPVVEEAQEKPQAKRGPGRPKKERKVPNW